METLVFLPGQEGRPRELVWVDRDGTETPVTDVPRAYGEPRLSPDGKRLALTLYAGSRCSTWVLNLERGSMTRVNFTGDNHNALWTPDGERLSFSRFAGTRSIYWRRADGSSEEELLHGRGAPGSWSPDGSTLLIEDRRPETGWDIWRLSLGEDAQVFLETPFHERGAAFSPGGLFVAYGSDETGKEEVYIRPYPGPGGRVPISVDGGGFPRWSASGEELFYTAPVEGRAMTFAMMAVPIALSPDVRPGQPVELFQFVNRQGGNQYDVTGDGQRFVIAKGDNIDVDSIEVVKNWFEELKRLVPAAN